MLHSSPVDSLCTFPNSSTARKAEISLCNFLATGFREFRLLVVSTVNSIFGELDSPYDIQQIGRKGFDEVLRRCTQNQTVQHVIEFFGVTINCNIWKIFWPVLQPRKAVEDKLKCHCDDKYQLCIRSETCKCKSEMSLVSVPRQLCKLTKGKSIRCLAPGRLDLNDELVMRFVKTSGPVTLACVTYLQQRPFDPHLILIRDPH